MTKQTEHCLCLNIQSRFQLNSKSDFDDSIQIQLTHFVSKTMFIWGSIKLGSIQVNHDFNLNAVPK